MINFADGYGNSEDILSINPKKLKKLIKSILNKDPYSEGSTHGGLSPTVIQEIINYLMYAENNQTIYLKIDKDIDEYHLNLTIGKKKK